MESKLSREIIHSAGVHETQGVPHGLWGQHALACDWADATIGQGGCHDASTFAGHFNGAQLKRGEPFLY